MSLKELESLVESVVGKCYPVNHSDMIFRMHDASGRGYYWYVSEPTGGARHYQTLKLAQKRVDELYKMESK